MEIYALHDSAQGFGVDFASHSKIRPPHFVSKAIKMFCPIGSEGGLRRIVPRFSSCGEVNGIYVEIYFIV